MAFKGKGLYSARKISVIFR